VIYLAIFAVVAAFGIGALWIHQKRQRRHLHSVHGFRTSLERISTHDVAVPRSRPERTGWTSPRPSGRRRPEPLDPARREAARMRLERRRAARA
jgi:hypothetical protein